MLPGRQLPPECHTELHTDYGGAAVRWGLTHHKESAYDCCMACLDQAKRAKPGQRKCNIWVYCPSETGCFSPDVYNHKYRECWLKYVSWIMKSNSHLAVEILIVIVLCSQRHHSRTSRTGILKLIEMHTHEHRWLCRGRREWSADG